MSDEAADTWANARRILCVRLDGIGDVIMMTPAMRALAAGANDRRLTLLTLPSATALAAMFPFPCEAIEYEAPWVKATSRQQPDAERELIERLRGRFDGGVIFTSFSQSPLPAATLLTAAGIPLRAAYCRENPYRLLTDWLPETEPEQGIRHEVQRQLDLVRSLGSEVDNQRLALRAPRRARHRVRRLLDASGARLESPLVLVHAGATAPSRRYPFDKYAAVAERLSAEGCVVVFTGSSTEQELIHEIQSRMRHRSVSLAGCLALEELACLIERANVVVTNNTGPAHMAAALGTPVVVLYALTNPQHTPWMATSRILYHDVPCRSCFKSSCPEEHGHCLSLVTPEDVVAATRSLLARESVPVTAHTTGSMVA
jgi:lipopolysaccharide heptosyltransferase II